MTPDDDMNAKEQPPMRPPHDHDHMHGSDGEAPQEGDVVRAGEPLDRSKYTVASEEAVIEAMRGVYDPEIPVNIYDLGLIYKIDIHDNGDVDIAMTLTAPACPVAGTLPKEVADKVSNVEGIGVASVAITWDPPWTPANMSETARVALDMF